MLPIAAVEFSGKNNAIVLQAVSDMTYVALELFRLMRFLVIIIC